HEGKAPRRAAHKGERRWKGQDPGGRSDRRGGIMRSRLLLALTAAALVTAATAAPSLAVATSGIPPAIPGTSSNFELVGKNPLFHRGMNAAPAIFGNYLYVGNRSDGSNTCPDGSTGC